MSFWKNKKIFTPAFALFFFLLFSVAATFALFEPWQLKLSDAQRPENMPSKDIFIVKIDDRSLDSQSGLGPFANWNRGYFAQVLDNINKNEPKVVGIDFFFRAAKDAEGDNALKSALSAANNPVIVFPSNPTFLSEKGYFIKEEKAELFPPLELFANVPNITLALNNMLPDSDKIVRKLLPGIYDPGRKIFDESFSFAVARKALGIADAANVNDITNSGYRLQNIPLEGGQMLINYFVHERNFSQRYQWTSFINVYNENYSGLNPEEIFKDKIVLIGAEADSFRDSYQTPTGGQRLMPGVEIHANAIQTILEKKFLRNMTLPEKAALLLILAFAAAYIFMYTKIRWSLAFLILVPTAYTLAAAPLFKSGLILDLVHPYLALISVFVATYMYRYVTEFKEKMALQGAFSRYVNPGVARQIAENPEKFKLGGEKRPITVLFTDIAHFTTISESLKPESTVALLNEYLEAMSSVILDCGGTMDKFEGDAIVAFFGAPVSQADHAARAARAAVNMRLKLNELLQKWQTDPPLPGGEKKPMIDFRCGLSSGEAIVGNIGSAQKIEYTAIGDIVNLGSRLEGANKKYSTHIMVSEATYDQIKDAFEGREIDTIRVVGKTQPIRVHEILAFKGALPAEAMNLLQLYGEGIGLYHDRKFAEALAKFNDILKVYPEDGPSKLYRQRCEVLRDFPPKPDWDGVFEMGTK